MLQNQQMVKLNNVFQVICAREIDARKQNLKKFSRSWKENVWYLKTTRETKTLIKQLISLIT